MRANDACFIFATTTGRRLGISIEEETGRRSAAKLRTRDEARRLAVNFAKLLRVGPAQIATGCCLVAAIIYRPTLSTGAGLQSK